MSDLLNPTQAVLEQWVTTVAAALPTAALGERVALSNLLVAVTQSRETGNVLAAEVVALRAWKAEAQRFERSLASLMLERESPAPQTRCTEIHPYCGTVAQCPNWALPGTNRCERHPQTSAAPSPASPPRLRIVPLSVAGVLTTVGEPPEGA